MQLTIDRHTLSPVKVLGWMVGVQAAILLIVLVLPPAASVPVAVGLGGLILFSILPVYPEAVFPLLISASALDLSGHLIENTGFFSALDIPLTGFHLAGGATIVFCVLNALFEKRSQFPRIEGMFPLIAFLVLYGLSVSYSPQQLEAIILFFRLLALTALVFAVLYIVRSRSAVTIAIVTLILWELVMSVLGIVQTLTSQFYFQAAFVNLVGASIPRATGTFHNPNDFATLLMVGIVITASLLANLKVASWKRGVFLLILLVLTAGLVTSFSRTNWLAMAVGLVFVAVLSRKLRFLVTIALAFSIVIACITLISSNFAQIVLGRFTSIFSTVTQFEKATNVSGSSRVLLVQAALAMFADHPLLGIGARGFPAMFDRYKPLDYPTGLPVNECHTLPALILSELGILGFVAFAAFVVAVVRAGVKAAMSIDDRYLRALEIGLVSVFIAYQVSFLFTAAIEDNYFWISTGLLFAVKRVADAESSALAAVPAVTPVT